MKKVKKSKFIAIEGGEGSGKSSLLKVIKETISDSIFITREPGGSPYAEAIREMVLKHELAKDVNPETTLCLMFASRFDHIKNTIKPCLERGMNVITDRFDASSFAYNVKAQSKGKLNILFWTLRKHLNIIPDLYIYIDAGIKEGLRRANNRNKSSSEGNHFDAQDIKFHQEVRKGYREFFEHKGINFVTIDGNQPFQKVKEDLVKIIKRELRIK